MTSSISARSSPQLRAKAVVAQVERVECVSVSPRTFCESVMPAPPLRLGVNIDHVATLRNARGGASPIRCARRWRRSRPAPTASPRICARIAAISATSDMARLKARDLEAAEFRDGGDRRTWCASRSRRSRTRCASCPSGAQELTTEGGLDVVGQRNSSGAVHRASSTMPASGCRCSSPPIPRRSRWRRKLGAPVIEIHTGALVRRRRRRRCREGRGEWQRIVAGAALAQAAGLEVHAGHGLDYETAETIAALPEIVELNIGHFMMGEAMFVGPRRGGAQHARGDGPRPERSRARHDHRHRLRPDRHHAASSKVIERHGERFLDRIFTAAERAQGGAPRQEREDGGQPMPSASPPRRPARRRWAPASGAGVWWRDMGVVNLPAGGPTMQLTGGRAGPGCRR